MNLKWVDNQNEIDWNELKELYRIAPLAIKDLDLLKTTFINSMYKCFVYDEDKLIGVGRALADGGDCSYICDIAIHPRYQGMGIGKNIVKYLIEKSRGHKKIILYANPGGEGFYLKLGFKKMNTAMAIFENEKYLIENGTISEWLWDYDDMVYGSNGMKLGAYAEYVSVDVKNTIKKVPTDLDYKDALPLLDGGITALPFLKRSR